MRFPLGSVCGCWSPCGWYVAMSFFSSRMRCGSVVVWLFVQYAMILCGVGSCGGGWVLGCPWNVIVSL